MPPDASAAANARFSMGDTDANNWIARKAELLKGLPDFADVQNDAFAQLFATIQQAKDNSDKNPPPDNSTPAPENSAAPCQKPASNDGSFNPPNNGATKTADNNANNSDSTKTQTHGKGRHHHHHHCMLSLADVTAPATDTSSEGKVSTDETQVAAASNAQTPASDTPPPPAAKADDNSQAAFGLSVALQAQQCKDNACEAPPQPSESEDDQDKNAQNQNSKGGNGLNSLLSFCANLAAGVPASGDQSADGNTAPQPLANPQDVAGLGKDAPKPDVSLPAAPDLTAENNAGSGDNSTQNQTPPDGKDFDFTSLFKDLTQPSKQEGVKEQFVADASTQAPAPAVQTDDPLVLTSPPAAGSRVNAPLGFSAPALTGSGGGSPPSRGLEIQSAMGVGTSNDLAGIDGGAPVQLLRAARGMANLSPPEQVATVLARMVKNGNTSFNLQLHPAELGKVDIRLDIDKDGHVQATITADNPSTLAALQKDSSGLEKVLQQAGLQTDSNSLSFNLRGGDGQPASQQQNAYQDSSGWRRWTDNTSIDTGAETQAAVYVATPDRVDLMV